MFLSKIKENDSGHSAINFVTVILIIMCLSCAFLDLTNLVRLRSVVTHSSNLLVEHCTVQSGFCAAVPDDWKDVYSSNIDYWTSAIAYNQVNKNLEKTSAISNSLKISLNNKTTGLNKIVSPGNDCKMSFKDEGELIVECKYNLGYLKAFGLLKQEYTCKITNPVVGFWVHKTTSI